jgi:hypothetical protein
VKCVACRTTRRVDLSHVIWPRKYQVHTLRPKLFCEPCRVRPDHQGIRGLPRLRQLAIGDA